LVGHVLDHLDDAFDILGSGFQVVDQGFRTMDIGRDIADASAASLITLTPLLASLPDSIVMELASDARSATWFTLTVICSTVAATLAEALLCWLAALATCAELPDRASDTLAMDKAPALISFRLSCRRLSRLLRSWPPCPVRHCG
jgi:hypothetical protein